MGWDYYTYEAQPPFFIEQILIIMNQVRQKENQELNAQKNKAKSIRPFKSVKQ